jgi:hypothetical protein
MPLKTFSGKGFKILYRKITIFYLFYKCLLFLAFGWFIFLLLYHWEFTRKEATEIGTKFKLSVRTVNDVLKSATGVSFTRIKAGHYQM